jgi:hypothetical protein
VTATDTRLHSERGGLFLPGDVSFHIAGVSLEQLNKTLSVVVIVVVVLTIELGWERRGSEPINGPWFMQAVLTSHQPVGENFTRNSAGPVAGWKRPLTVCSILTRRVLDF